MYQLSHLLTEQRSLIVTLLENSILGDKAPGLRGVETKPSSKSKIGKIISPSNGESNQDGRKRLTAILEKVEGCAVRIFHFIFLNLDQTTTKSPHLFILECC